MEAVGVVVVPNVTLFTKGGCTLCDKVKDVLESIRTDHPHSLYAIDITDNDKTHWFDKYKYDIPVLHMNGIYWAKHRLTIDDATAGLMEASNGQFTPRGGEPDASRLERN
jgi:glutaredoxin